MITTLGLAVFTAMLVLIAAVLRWRSAGRTLGQLCDTSVPLPGECGFCFDLTTMGDPGDCACPRPCGKDWCTALRRTRRAVMAAQAADDGHGNCDELGRP